MTLGRLESDSARHPVVYCFMTSTPRLFGYIAPAFSGILLSQRATMKTSRRENHGSRMAGGPLLTPPIARAAARMDESATGRSHRAFTHLGEEMEKALTPSVNRSSIELIQSVAGSASSPRENEPAGRGSDPNDSRPAPTRAATHARAARDHLLSPAAANASDRGPASADFDEHDLAHPRPAPADSPAPSRRP